MAGTLKALNILKKKFLSIKFAKLQDHTSETVCQGIRRVMCFFRVAS